jgi:hypothetical protein
MVDYSRFQTALEEQGVTVYFCGLSTTEKYVRLVTDDKKETQKVLMETCRRVGKELGLNLDYLEKKTAHVDRNIIGGKELKHVRNLMIPFVEENVWKPWGRK